MPLRARKPRIDPNRLYRAWTSFAVHDSWQVIPEGTTLGGTHPLVIRYPDRFVPADMPDDEVHRVRLAHYAAREQPKARVDAQRTIIEQPTPASRRVRAVKTYIGRDGTAFDKGSVWDARDAFVKANPELFEVLPDDAA